MTFIAASMIYRVQQESAVDCLAAAIFAGSVAFAAAALAGGLFAAIAAPAAFLAAYAALGTVDGEPWHQLGGFGLEPIIAAVEEDEDRDETVVRLFDPRQFDIARPSATSTASDTADDAGRALTEALSKLKQSLR